MKESSRQANLKAVNMLKHLVWGGWQGNQPPARPMHTDARPPVESPQGRCASCKASPGFLHPYPGRGLLCGSCVEKADKENFGADA